MSPEQFNARLKMYVLVRKDILTDVQCGVQAAHALAEYMNSFLDSDPKLREWVEDHKTLIFLSASEKQLYEKKVAYPSWASFKEPDIGDIETAVAFSPVTHERGVELFGDLNLI